MNGPTMKRPWGNGASDETGRSSRCSTRCNPAERLHFVLSESKVADIHDMKWRHMGRSITLLEDQDHAPPYTVGHIVDILPAIEHGVPLDPEYPHVWLIAVELEPFV